MSIWNQWCAHRQTEDGEVIPSIESELKSEDLAKYMSGFIFELRNKDGKEFPPNSLHHIVCGIQRNLGHNFKSTIDVFKDPAFLEFRICLDAEMKRLQQEGLGSRTRKAEPLTIEDEELLWSKGLLGKHSPQALLDTIIFMNGLYFALRSGKEHRQLRGEPCQIIVHERD